MRSYPIKRGVLPFALAFSAHLGTASELGTNPNELLLDEIKYSLLSQALDAGLSISSAGFIDSTGKLIESTYFRMDSSIDGLRNKRLMERRNSSTPAVQRFVESFSQRQNGCNNQSNKYRKEINVLFEGNNWGSSTDSTLQLEIKDIVITALSNEIGRSSTWYSTRDPQDTESVDTTQYFAAVSPQNKDTRSSRYVIQVNMTTDRGNPPVLEGLRTIRSAGAKFLLSTTNSQLVFPLARKDSSSPFKVTLDISFIDSLNGIELAGYDIQFYTSSSTHNLMPRRLTSANREALNQGLDQFLEILEKARDCDFEETPITIDKNYEAAGVTWVRINKGSAAGIRLGDRFILSSTRLNQRHLLLNPEVLQSIVIGEVMAKNEKKA
jgi:hypothetical protein